MPKIKKEEIVAFTENLIDFALKGRKESGVLTRYYKSIRYFDGKHKIKDNPVDKGNQVWNKYAEVFENRIAHIVAKRPKWKFRPKTEVALLSNDIVNQIMGDLIWDVDNWESKGEDSLWEAAHGGSCFIEIIMKNENQGLPGTVIIPNPSIALDPAAKKKEDLRYIVRFIEMNISEIKKKYGVDINAEDNLENIEDITSYEEPEKTYYSSTANQMPNIWAQIGLSDVGKQTWMQDVFGRAKVAEVWMDYDEEEKIPFDIKETEEEHALFENFKNDIPVKDENHVEHIKQHRLYLATLNPELDTNKIDLVGHHINLHLQYPQFEKRPKYPLGRVITICQGNLLRDIPNPAPVHWKKLWIKWDYSKNINSIYGKPLGQDLIDPQDALNHRKNSITRNINMLNHGIRKYVVGGYEKLKDMLSKFSNKIGIVIPVRHKDDYTVDFGPPLPPQFFQDVYYDEQFIDRMSGNEDALAGRLPAAGTANVTMETLLREGQKRINLAVKHYINALQEIGRTMLEILKEIGSDELLFKVTQGGKYGNVKWKDIKDFIDIEDIKIDVESTTSTSRTEKLREAIELRNGGVYDNQAVLERLDDPDKWEILQRTSEIMLLKQQLGIAVQEIDRVDKENNTLRNRLQGKEGEGNVGSQKTTE